MDLTPTRKSGRQRVPNKKYTDDLFKEIDQEISDEDEVSAPKTVRRRREQSPKIDEDFDIEEVAPEPELSGDGESSAGAVSEGSRIATPDASDDDPGVDISSPGEKARRKTKTKPPLEVHSRGLAEKLILLSHRSEVAFIKEIIGENIDDLMNFEKARNKWAYNVTLPTQYSDHRGWGGMRRPFNHTSDQRKMEATVGWDWYYSEGGRALFAKNQNTEILLSASESTDYLPKPNSNNQSLLMGSYGRQKLFSIPFLQCLNINDAWSQALTADNTDAEAFINNTARKRQDGWILNVGTSVQCLEWVPNQSTNTQYFVVSTAKSKSSILKNLSETAPAYTPLPGVSCIQIWSFVAPRRLSEDSEVPPALRLLICNNWGHAKQLKWCPTPREIRERDTTYPLSLGLLAGVFADGYVRVLDVALDELSQSSTSYIKYQSAAFAAKPTDAMCSCVTWLSSSDIAVGCSNGHVAIWNIYPPPKPDKEEIEVQIMDPGSSSTAHPQAAASSTDLVTEAMPVPYFYEAIHNTYIHAIASAYPSHPNLICTSSSSGYLQLTDIRSPASDYVLSPRVHWPPSTIVYCVALSCFVTYDEGGTVKALPLRRFWSGIGLAKGESEIISLDVGHLHTSILVGFADGTLLAANPTRRFLVAKSKAVPQQKVWRHEWARAKIDADNNNSTERQNESHQHRQPEGVSRITEGYKIESSVLSPTHTDVSKSQVAKTGITPHMYTTIYDEETAVRQIAWNPNETWGGWAASGTGSGLVRIENLAV